MTRAAPPARDRSPRPARELLTIDLRGLQPRLLRRSRERGLAASQLVREALEAHLAGEGPAPEASPAPPATGDAAPGVRICLRLPRAQAVALQQRARLAGLSIASYIVLLMRDAREPVSATEWQASRSALTASNAELSALARHLAHLCALLRQGEVRAAMEYRRVLDDANGLIRQHLRDASHLAALLERERRPNREDDTP